MKRRQRKWLYLFAVLLLGYALYLSLFTNEEPEAPIRHQQHQITKK